MRRYLLAAARKRAIVVIVRRTNAFFLLVIALTLSRISLASDTEEVALYDSDGKPVAYIAEDLTIYMWSGEPAAYLSPANNQAHGFNVYGFNGHHLGWFAKGVIRDHDGDASCGLKSVVSSPQFEPFKSFRSSNPSKASKSMNLLNPHFPRCGQRLLVPWSFAPAPKNRGIVPLFYGKADLRCKHGGMSLMRLAVLLGWRL